MTTSKSLQLVGALVLTSLIYSSSAIAQEDKEGEFSPDSGVGGSGVTIDPEFMEVSSLHVAALSRRLEDAKVLGDLEDSIDEILRVIQDLLDERQEWFKQRQKIARALDAVRDDIRDLSDQIDDIEDAIAVSAVATAGIPNPELVVTRDALVIRKNRLKKERERLRNDLAAADQRIAQLQGEIDGANAALAEKQEEKRQLQEHIEEVLLVAPSHGARLLVDSREELKIRADRPPRQVMVEVQEYVTSRGSGSGVLIRQSWKTVYSRTLAWKDLASAGPGVVSLAFKTGTRPQGRSMPIVGLEAFWLAAGEYRARVARAGEAAQGGARGGTGGGADSEEKRPPAEMPQDRSAESEDMKSVLTGTSAADSSGNRDVDSMRNPSGGSGSRRPIVWLRFTVVGKLDRAVLGGRDPEPEPEGSTIKYGTQQVKPGAVLRPTAPEEEKEEEQEEPPDG